MTVRRPPGVWMETLGRYPALNMGAFPDGPVTRDEFLEGLRLPAGTTLPPVRLKAIEWLTALIPGAEILDYGDFDPDDILSCQEYNSRIAKMTTSHPDHD